MKEESNAVIIERLDNLKEYMENFKLSNDKQHKDLDINQKKTNGKVRNLQVWKGTFTGAIAVIVFLISFFIKDYIALRDDHSTNNTRLEKIEEECKSITQ